MRIGIMLRHLDQHGGGLLGYTRHIVHHLLRLDVDHEFVLLYRTGRFRGAFGDRPREVVEPARTRLTWDQVAAPRAAAREGVEVLFNPKFSVPLVGGPPSVYVCHGMDWYVEPRWSRWQDRLSHRLLIPRYARRASRIIAVSESARDHAIHFLDIEPQRVRTVRLGVGREFFEPVPPERVEQVRRELDLPQRYFLYCGQIYPPKNFGRLLQAYAEVGPPAGIHLVVAGTHRELCESEIALVEPLGLDEWVRWAGWVDHDVLPAFYRGAVALVMPSLYEAWPSPPLEAMACDCPVVTSDRYGTKEVAGDAAVLVDPESVEDIARGMASVARDPDLRERLVEAGRKRARYFTWERCARETMEVLEEAARHPR